MPYVLIRHTVRNFKKWKTGYDAHSTTRKKAGSKGARLFRNVDKPTETVILVKWNRLATARRFAKSRDLRAAMKRLGVMGRPDIYFLEEVDHSRA